MIMSNIPKTVTYEKEQAQGTLTLQGTVDIFEAAMLYETVKHIASDHEAVSVCVDFTNAKRLDISAIQLLLTLRNELEANRRRFIIRGNDSLIEKIFSPLGISLKP